MRSPLHGWWLWVGLCRPCAGTHPECCRPLPGCRSQLLNINKKLQKESIQLRTERLAKKILRYCSIRASKKFRWMKSLFQWKLRAKIYYPEQLSNFCLLPGNQLKVLCLPKNIKRKMTFRKQPESLYAAFSVSCVVCPAEMECSVLVNDPPAPRSN